MERATGIEPASSAWKAGVLPLNYARKIWSGRQDLNLRHPAPKAGALPTALHPDIFDFLLCQSCEFQYNNPLRFPQKHSRTARLERVALLVVFSPQSFA